MGISGRIIKAVSGFYYVKPDRGQETEVPPKDGNVYQCRAKGIFRKKKLSPLVGDRVVMELTATDDVEGNVTEISDRKNSLIRPQVANVDQALLIFAMHTPEPAPDLIDRFLVLMKKSGIDVILIFNKNDLGNDIEIEKYKSIYKDAGIRLIFTSTIDGSGVPEVREILKNSVTTVAGPSGAGKSSLINAVSGREIMVTGEVSRKIGRGKQTTRHVELVEIEEDSYIIDTPGFSSLELPEMEPLELQDCFPEIGRYKNECYFAGCSHISEPDCGVRDRLAKGLIPKERYDSYVLFYNDLVTLQNRRFR